MGPSRSEKWVVVYQPGSRAGASVINYLISTVFNQHSSRALREYRTGSYRRLVRGRTRGKGRNGRGRRLVGTDGAQTGGP